MRITSRWVRVASSSALLGAGAFLPHHPGGLGQRRAGEPVPGGGGAATAVLAARSGVAQFNLLWVAAGHRCACCCWPSRWCFAGAWPHCAGWPAAIGALERGESERLGGDYPGELRPLTDNLNTTCYLIANERRRERVRNTMDRLTHVLKTPLMLIRNSRDGDSRFRPLVQEQVQPHAGYRRGRAGQGATGRSRVADLLGKPVTGANRCCSASPMPTQRLPRTGPTKCQRAGGRASTRATSTPGCRGSTARSATCRTCSAASSRTP